MSQYFYMSQILALMILPIYILLPIRLRLRALKFYASFVFKTSTLIHKKANS